MIRDSWLRLVRLGEHGRAVMPCDVLLRRVGHSLGHGVDGCVC